MLRRLTAAAILAAGAAHAETAAPDPATLIDETVVRDIRAILASDVVSISIEAQNARYDGADAARIEALDKTWVAEREAADKPLIAATLSSPLSTYLIRTQARSLGLYAEIFVMDRYGLNVGQSSITSDFWQGDEAKFQKSFGAGPDAVFVDEAEWDADNGIWRSQVSVTVVGDDGRPMGAATFEFNLTELMRRRTSGV